MWRRLIELGVDFDRTETGEPHLTLEGGHTRARILHHKDCTGKEIVEKLIANVKQCENVTIYENSVVCDICKTGHTFHLERTVETGPTAPTIQLFLFSSRAVSAAFTSTRQTPPSQPETALRSPTAWERRSATCTLSSSTRLPSPIRIPANAFWYPKACEAKGHIS